MTTVCTKWIQPSSHIDSIQWKMCICEACSIIFTAYIDCFMHWIHPNSPISASKVAHLKYANKSRHDCWFPLNFLFRHGQTEITEVFCRKPLALLPPSAGPHFIWIINDKSFFFQATQRRFSFSCVFQFKEKMEPWRRIVVFRCKARPRVCRSRRPTEAAHRIYSAIQSWKIFFEAVQMIGFSLYFE